MKQEVKNVKLHFASVSAYAQVRMQDAPIFFFENVKFNYVFQPCNDTFQFDVIVPALYDEYTALVKSENVSSKHVNGW